MTTGYGDFEFIDEPLITEDGLVNPVCIAKLNAAINNMPNIHERMSGNPEWEAKNDISWRQITGGLAYWAIRQIPEPYNTPFPPGLEKVIGFLSSCIRPKFDKLGYAQLSLGDIAKLLYDTLMPEPMFLAWNDYKILPGWIDLDALIRNVCIEIRDELRKNAESHKEFEKKYGK